MWRLVTVSIAAAVAAGAPGGRPNTAASAPAGRKLNPRIVALGDNTWLKMSPAREPEGRNYSGCCWGDWGKGGRIFYFGGAHFSYPYDDVELYDIAANTWTRSWKDRKNWMADGKPALPPAERFAEAVRLGRLPPTHTYQQVCWVPGRKVFFHLGHSGNWTFDPLKMRWTCLALPPLYQTGSKKMIPWTRWAVQTMHCYYSPVVEAPVAITTHKPQGDWLFDLKTMTWKALKRNIPAMGGEIYSAPVPPLKAQLLSNRNGRMHLHRVSGVASTWTELENVPEALKGAEALAYDSANRVVIAVAPGKGRAPLAVWRLDPATLTWAELKPKGPVPRGSGLWAPLWYDADHNAFVFLNRTGQTG